MEKKLEYPRSSKKEVARKNYVESLGLSAEHLINIGEWWSVTRAGDLIFFGAKSVVFCLRGSEICNHSLEYVMEKLESKVWFNEAGPYDTTNVRNDLQSAYMCAQGRLFVRNRSKKC